ncbi:MmgE/PrpD family protein [Orrella sp. 11846]|uniref:MmgE/PrpD family protein n=1 Tax=Orrella sp. 11846 TaxID=3409913 RepID=UPI003B5A36B9
MLLEKLSQYGASEAIDQKPAEVMHHAKRAVLDWFSALYPGTHVAPCNQLMKAYAQELGLGHCSLPGNHTTTFAATAAWINGSASHAVEFDDIFRDGAYHPGCPTISAALAIAEDLNASGRDFLNAIVVGYEISTRIAATIQPAHYRFFHTTGTVGCLGAAAAAAALQAPGDAQVMAHAIATAATFASGLQQAFRSDAMTKALHAGHAAAIGVRAAQAAAAGVTGVTDILEGQAGLGAALSENVDWSHTTDGLGTHYNITQITQKNHGCCGHTFAAIDAALYLRAQHNIEPQDIQSIHVSTYQTAINVAGITNPATPYEGKFSLAYVIAHALVYGSVRLDAFEPDRLQDKTIRTLMANTTLEADPEISARFPKQRAANLVLTLKDGREVAFFAPTRKGDPDAPLSDAELNDKFDELVRPVLGLEQADLLREQIWALDTMRIRDLKLA